MTSGRTRRKHHSWQSPICFMQVNKIICCGSDPNQFSYLKSVLLCFHAVSRLRLDLSKSKLILVGEVT